MINLNLKNRFLSFNLVSLIFLQSRPGKIKKKQENSKKRIYFATELIEGIIVHRK